MEPQHFNWLEACAALVLCKHELDKAELKAAKRPAEKELKDAYVLAWHAHHKAVSDEFMARHVLV
jgi:hypothetical protein